MVSWMFRIVLIICSLVTAGYMIRKIRNSKLQIEHAVFWIVVSFGLVVLSVFPQLTILGANILGIYSSTNFIFLVILFIVIIKLFKTTVEISTLEHRIKELTQKIALDEKLKEETAQKEEM